MGLFGKKKDSPLLEERLFRLESKNDELEREIRGLRLEYIELYDKVSHQMSRMSKRHAAALKENGSETTTAPDDSPGDTLDPISRSIMMRRARQLPTQ